MIAFTFVGIDMNFKKFLNVLALFTFCAHGALAQECMPAGESIEVLAVPMDSNPALAYEIFIINRGPSQILALALGRNAVDTIPADDSIAPSQTASPVHWTYRRSFTENSLNMRLLWSTKAPEGYVQPKSILTGFKLVLKPFPEKSRGQKYPDGKPFDQLQISNMPFEVITKDGACAWGKVVTIQKR
jgi:hypothetical protein